MWIPNNDDPGYMIFDKGRSFLKLSQLMHNQFDNVFRDEVVLPMIGQRIYEIPAEPDVLDLVALKQEPLDEQDSY
jgi:hypothetical protein